MAEGLKAWLLSKGIPYTEGVLNDPSQSVKHPSQPTGGGIPGTEGVQRDPSQGVGGGNAPTTGSGGIPGTEGAAAAADGDNPKDLQQASMFDIDPGEGSQPQGADLGADAEDAPASKGHVLARTGPGQGGTVASVAGNPDTGKTSALSDNDPQTVGDLETGGTPSIASEDAASAAAAGAKNMDIGQGSLKDLTKSYPADAPGLERARAIQKLQAAQEAERMGRQPVAPADAPERVAKSEGAPMFRVAGPAIYTDATDRMVDEFMKSKDAGVQPPAMGLGEGNDLTNKVVCKSCKAEVPALYKAGTCPGCGHEMSKGMPSLAPLADQSRYLRPPANQDLQLPGFRMELVGRPK